MCEDCLIQFELKSQGREESEIYSLSKRQKTYLLKSHFQKEGKIYKNGQVSLKEKLEDDII